MRILIATSHRNMVGGVEKYLQQMLPTLWPGADTNWLCCTNLISIPRRNASIPGNSICRAAALAESGVDAGLDSPAIGSPMWCTRRAWKPRICSPRLLERISQRVLMPTITSALASAEEKCHAFPTPQPCDRQFGPACLVLYLPRRCGGLNPVTMWKMFQRAAVTEGTFPNTRRFLVASEHMRREYERHGVQPGEDRSGGFA